MIKKQPWLAHILGIIAFLIVPLLFAPHPPEAKDILFEKPTIRDFLASCFMLLFFYLNYYLFIPKLYFKKKYVVYGLLVLVGLLLISYLPSVLTGHDLFSPKPSVGGIPLGGIPLGGIPSDGVPFDNAGKFPPRPDNFSPLQEIRHHIFLYAAVIMFSVLLRVRSLLLKTENEKLQAELSNLKAQIQPHFLFNTLNSIYALAIRKDDKAPETIVKLSEFMRYLLKDSNQSLVSLEKEMVYIENYIDLQKSRLRNSVKLHYQANGDFEAKEIAPLVLFTYIENAFKHGVNPDQDSEISITINVIENNLKLEVFNKIVSELNRETSLNIGLKNTAERLQMMYADKHKLLIINRDGIYKVNLQIELA